MLSGTDEAKTYNVSQGLLRVVQRAMAAGVMIELYRQMQEVSLFCFVNNALPRIKAHLYENLDRFHTVEEAIALAERYEIGRGGGIISKFSINAFQEHMSGSSKQDYNNTNNTNPESMSSQVAAETQEDLEHQYGEQPYDCQINAINRSLRRGGRRNTWPWGRGRGNSSGGGLPFAANPIPGGGLGHYHNANDSTTAKKGLLCYHCGSASHIVTDCHYPPVATNNPKNFATTRGRGRFRTFQRREKFNSMGIYMGTEDVPVYYDSVNDRIEELPDTTHEGAEGYAEPGEINVLNENKFGNLDYLGVAEDEVNIDSYFQNDVPRREI